MREFLESLEKWGIALRIQDDLLEIKKDTGSRIITAETALKWLKKAGELEIKIARILASSPYSAERDARIGRHALIIGYIEKTIGTAMAMVPEDTPEILVSTGTIRTSI